MLATQRVRFATTAVEGCATERCHNPRNSPRHVTELVDNSELDEYIYVMKFLTADAAQAFVLDNLIADRKFEVTDLNPTLEAAARTIAGAWVAPSANHWSNAFMLDMKYRVSKAKPLSAGQAKGVLNVVRSEFTPKPAKVEDDAPAASIAKVRTARFRVVAADGQSIAVRLSVPTMWTDAPKGTRKIATRTADGWSTVGKAEPDGSVKLFAKTDKVLKARVLSALDTLQNADDDLVYILAYAMEGSECGFCGLALDTVESLTVGYGPTCAKKHDLPWGAKAVPAKVLLAKQGLAEADEAVDEVTVGTVANPVAVEAPKHKSVATVGPSLETLKATLDNAHAELMTTDDDETSFARFLAAKAALKAALAFPPKADYDVQHDTDGAVVTGAGVVLRPFAPVLYDADADDLAANADLMNDAAAGN